MSSVRPLSTVQLDEILNNLSVTRRKYLGTYPACVHPKSKKSCYAFISNIDEHDEAGQHWCAWVVKEDTVSFFDSFGREPWNESFPYHFREIVDEFKRIKYTNTRIQNWASKTCGYFCIHFIYSMCLGLRYEDFLNDYSENYLNNDSVVIDFLNSI